MTRIATLVGITLITAAPLTAALAQQAASPPMPNQPGNPNAVLLGSDSIVGSTVRNPDGQDVGKVSRLMIDPADGRVATVVISTGGTLGIGSNTISVPWNSVKVGHDRGKLIVTASQMLDTAPKAESQKANNANDQSQKKQ